MGLLVRWIGGALVATALLAPAGCGDAPSKKDCEKLLDNVVSLEVAEAGTEALPAEMKAEVDKQKEKLRGYIGKEFVDACVKGLKKSHVTCGIKAASKEALAACEKEE